MICARTHLGIAVRICILKETRETHVARRHTGVCSERLPDCYNYSSSQTGRGARWITDFWINCYNYHAPAGRALLFISQELPKIVLPIPITCSYFGSRSMAKCCKTSFVQYTKTKQITPLLLFSELIPDFE